MAQRYAGRLELTWTNKDQSLLAHEDGSYEWLPPADYRVAEVRLLHDAGTVGQVGSGAARSRDNLLIRGDALYGLTSLIELPEFANAVVGKVRLAYLDPPYNTQRSWLHYSDALEHSVWLTMMRDRLIQVKRLMADNGTVWVHCDDSEQAYLKAMMDEEFGRDCFVTAFIWQKVDSPNDNKVAVTPDHEYILCYAMQPGRADFKQMPDASIVEAYKGVAEDGTRYRDRLLRKNGKNSLRTDRPRSWFSMTAPDGTEVWPMHDDGREGCWAKGEATVRQLEAAGDIVWKERPAPSGEGLWWVPYTREIAPDLPSRPWPTIWTDVKTSRQAKAHLKELFPGVTPFSTPKPEELMARIIEIATDPGEIVLDCFVGSGTTAAVAHKMQRRWIAMERSEETLTTFTAPRLEMVVGGRDPGGISEPIGWPGGGGFRVLDVAPSMFVEEGGVVYLADWAVNGSLAEATAAQLGFVYEPSAPFCGRKGRQRLAVIDGLVNTDVARLLVEQLEDKDRVVVCGTALDPDVPAFVRTLRSGCTARKIPAALLKSYKRPVLVRLPVDPGGDTAAGEVESA